MDRDLVTRLVDCSTELQKIKASQIIAEDNYRTYNYTGSMSASAAWGAGGDIIFTGEKAFPLVALTSFKLYKNGSQLNFTQSGLAQYNGVVYYATDKDEALMVHTKLPQGLEPANQYIIEIEIQDGDWDAGESPNTYRCEFSLRTDCPGQITTNFGGYID